eukprot:1117315-Prorocentrum_lima.AAC.1
MWVWQPCGVVAAFAPLVEWGMSRGLACLDKGEAETGGPPARRGASPRRSACKAAVWTHPWATLGGCSDVRSRT